MTSSSSYEEFQRFVRTDLEIHFSNTNVETQIFLNQLGELNDKVIAEARKNLEEYINQKHDPSFFFGGMLKKALRLKEDLFQESGDYIIYVNYDRPINRYGNPEASYSYYIHSYLTDVILLYSEYSKIINKPLVEYKSNSKVKSGHVPEQDSFVLKNDNVNFNAVHRILAVDYNFIDNRTTVDDLKLLFSGKKVKSKVIWYKANSLRYFIRQIVDKETLKKDDNNDRNVQHPNDGIWQRTINCFKKPDRPYQEKDLEFTKDPVSSVTKLLDPAIKLINNPS